MPLRKITALFSCLTVFILSPFFVNGSPGGFLADTTSASKQDTLTNEIILYPDALPDRAGVGFLENPDQSLSTQIAYIDRGIGVEMIYTVAESRSFFSLMLGVMEPDLSLGFETNLLTSFTYGYKAIISRSNKSGVAPAIGFLGQPDFYVRIGPGISTLGTDHYEQEEWRSETMIGLHTFGVLGGTVDIARRSSLNIELGWRGLWFPASDALNFMSGPLVSVGFSFSGGSGSPAGPVSW